MKYLKGRNAPINDLEGGVNVESDCENYSTNVSGWISKEKNEETRAVLITGSFSAYVHFLAYPCSERNDEFFRWRSLFFYRCTDTISFAPLRSQGSSSRSSQGSLSRSSQGSLSLGSWDLFNLVSQDSLNPGPQGSLSLGSQGPSSRGRKKRKGVTTTPAFPPPSPKSVGVTTAPAFHTRLPKNVGATTAPVFPPCSPKSVYVLANLVRRSSIKRLGYEANASDQA